uniref:SH3 and cysteine-rich domain-containing protein isoform X2 n=1 Tax=Geotrypetes seraphini TaxID=260995 RepID=A0A6P8QG57_GEOSA|nr:SH3 and cysteine-rich domain-containing protein isoform X2 [Geotrypetes seraphini]
MIPPNSATEGDAEREKENNLGSLSQPASPASLASQQSKLQKLKRSLSFKTKSMRSKSVDNFFQRTNSEVKLQVDLLPEVSTNTAPPTSSESQSSTPTKAEQQPDTKTHIFQEYIFKKPMFCDICNHMIVGSSIAQLPVNASPKDKILEPCHRDTCVLDESSLNAKGTNAKHGLRCKACKMSIHHRCAESTGQQHCMGKLPKGFRRYYSSPLLIHEQFSCIKEVMPIACGNKVDPIYETLRFGTSLAQKNKKGSSGSGSDSPNKNSTLDLAEVPEESDRPNTSEMNRQPSDSVFSNLENGSENFREEQEPKNINSPTKVPPCTDSLDTYVALYKFVPQESEDLEMRPGDKITILDDSNEDWWKGKIEDRIGFFPSSFVQRVQQDERIFKCIRAFIGCKEQGQITLKVNQICATSEEEHEGFIKVYSGKKKGFVPLDALENI